MLYKIIKFQYTMIIGFFLLKLFKWINYAIQRVLKNCFCSSIIYFALSDNLGMTSLICFRWWWCLNLNSWANQIWHILIIKRLFSLLELRSRFSCCVFFLVRVAIESLIIFTLGNIDGKDSILVSSILSFRTFSF